MMNIDDVFVEFIRWAAVPILLLAFGLSSYNVYKNMKYWLRKHQTPVLFWGNWIEWYIILLCMVAWVILWVC